MKVKRTNPVNKSTRQARLLNPDFKYVPASKTDIVKRFRDLGWIPPSELKTQS
jgi:hypothetical protein